MAPLVWPFKFLGNSSMQEEFRTSKLSSEKPAKAMTRKDIPLRSKHHRGERHTMKEGRESDNYITDGREKRQKEGWSGQRAK